MRSITSAQIGLKLLQFEDIDRRSEYVLQDEIASWRNYLRQSHCFHDLQLTRPHTNVYGEPLHSTLVSFFEIALENTEEFRAELTKSQSIRESLKKPRHHVFVLQKDLENYVKSNAEIKQDIIVLLDYLDDLGDETVDLRKDLRSCTNKQSLVQLHMEVVTEVDDIISEMESMVNYV